MHYFVFFILSFFCFNFSNAMNHNGTDIESSDSSSSNSESDSEQEEMYMELDQPGNYEMHFSVRISNKSKENANLIIGVYINNKKSEYKQYLIAANSELTINDFLPVTYYANDLIELKFKAPNVVDLKNNGIDFIPVQSKTKL